MKRILVRRYDDGALAALAVDDRIASGAFVVHSPDAESLAIV